MYMKKVMMRMVVVAVMTLTTYTTAAAQDIYSGSTSLVTIDQEWEGETLSGVENGTIYAMLESFNKRWPTWMITCALKTMKKGMRLERYGDRLPTVFCDLPNGWVDVATSVMGAEFMNSCYWRRSNGHHLLGIYFGKPVSPTLHFVCFYDYDPQNHTLTPETHIIDGFRTTEDAKFYYQLPQHGKDMIVIEDGPRGHIIHTFKWDGMKPVYSKSEVQEDFADGDHCDEDEE